MVLRVTSFSKACTIHPATLESICDTKVYDQFYQEIKRDEIMDNPQGSYLEGSSSSSGINRGGIPPPDAKVEDVAPDILPASPSYKESLGASHGDKGTDKGTRKVRWGDIPDEEEEEEDIDKLLDSVEDPFDTEEEARKDALDTRQSLDKLDGAVETLMSNL